MEEPATLHVSGWMFWLFVAENRGDLRDGRQLIFLLNIFLFEGFRPNHRFPLVESFNMQFKVEDVCWYKETLLFLAEGENVFPRLTHSPRNPAIGLHQSHGHCECGPGWDACPWAKLDSWVSWPFCVWVVRLDDLSSKFEASCLRIA